MFLVVVNIGWWTLSEDLGLNDQTVRFFVALLFLNYKQPEPFLNDNSWIWLFVLYLLTRDVSCFISIQHKKTAFYEKAIAVI